LGERDFWIDKQGTLRSGCAQEKAQNEKCHDTKNSPSPEKLDTVRWV